ncbi:plasma membrane calcium [Elasticomyces elasticus]|uniref:Plasma membrane calcium n=1 Tax=Elasticomyces elasticus TaxID=574655 RepID=A0AAN7W1S4_9PEZI|nr:plasma membrane calcium [Elasticomyces elasticus]
MTVVTGTFGDLSFDDKNQAGDEVKSVAFARMLSKEKQRHLIESMALNSTAFETEDNGVATFVGSKAETALLTFAKTLGMANLAEERASASIVQLMPFDSARKCMGAVQKLPTGSYRLLVKGASEILLRHCSFVKSSVSVAALEGLQRESLEDVIDQYAKQSFRTIAVIEHEFKQWPWRWCHSAMVTGDNAVTAKAIATDCKIYTDGIVMEGLVFRNLPEEQFAATLPKLQVLARSSPEDKRILVTRLRAMCEIVAVTGDGTNDVPALKAADIGFSMGIAGTEVAKEASAIILMDDNFSSILTALMWGRAVNDAVRKFLQFQITVNIGAVILTFVSAVANDSMRSVLTTVQLLWINLIMDSLAALALATNLPTEEILDYKPQARNAALISVTMWKIIIGQTIYQLIVTFVLYYARPSILNYVIDGDEIRSVVFNAFVWMQIFNMFNARRLDNKFNVLQGVFSNYFFLIILAIMVGCQIMIVFVGGRAFQILAGGISGQDWGISIVLGALSLPFAILIRIFPDPWFTATARVCGTPVMAVLNPTGRAMHAFANKLRGLRRKKPESQSVSDRAEIEEKVVDMEKRADVENGHA